MVFGVLKNNADAETEIFERIALFPNVPAVEIKFARSRFHKPVQVLHKRGFSASRMPDNAYEITFFYLKAHVVQRDMLKRRSLRIYVSEVFGFYKCVI